jgi:hypothetical protein
LTATRGRVTMRACGCSVRDGNDEHDSSFERVPGAASAKARPTRAVAGLCVAAVVSSLIIVGVVTLHQDSANTAETVPQSTPAPVTDAVRATTSTTERATTSSVPGSPSEDTLTAIASDPTVTSSTSSSAPAPSSTSPAAPPDFGTSTLLDLDVSAGLIAAADESEAFIWSPATGAGFALQPISQATRPIAPIPSDVLSQLCFSDQPVWTGSIVFLAATTRYGMYSPTADSWTTGPVASERYCGRKRLTVWAASRIALLGGLTAPFEEPGSTPILTISLFDPVSATWTESSAAPSEHSGDLSAVFVHGVIALAGDGPSPTETLPILLYHLDSDTWTALDPPEPLTYTPYVTEFRDRLVAIGLDNTSAAWTDQSLSAWEPITPSAPADYGRHPVGFGSNDNRLVYLYGSQTPSVFDGVNWREASFLDLPTSWSSNGVAMAAGRLIVAGTSTNSASTSRAKVFTIAIDSIVPQYLD